MPLLISESFFLLILSPTDELFSKCILLFKHYSSCFSVFLFNEIIKVDGPQNALLNVYMCRMPIKVNNSDQQDNQREANMTRRKQRWPEATKTSKGEVDCDRLTCSKPRGNERGARRDDRERTSRDIWVAAATLTLFCFISTRFISTLRLKSSIF